MEHRWSTRKPVTGHVVVECPRLGRVRAAMCDISLGGMLISESAGALPLNAPVMVAFDVFPDEGRRASFRLQAMVVRHTPSGAGMMFLDPETEVIRSMRSALYDRSESGIPRRAVASPAVAEDSASERVALPE